MQSPHEQAFDPDSLEPEELRSIGGEIGRCFPQRCLATELVLMEISPHRLHAYWHVTPEDLAAAGERIAKGRAALVLRFHDLTEEPSSDGPAPTFDIEIEGASGRRYVELWEAARSYEAELGLKCDDDLLIVLARSNRVELPRAGSGQPHGAGVVTLTPDAVGLFSQDETRHRRQPPRALSADQETRWDPTLDSRSTLLPPRFPNALEGAPTYAEVLVKRTDDTPKEREAPATAVAQKDGPLATAAETALPDGGDLPPASIDSLSAGSLFAASPPYPLHQTAVGTVGWAEAIVAAIAAGRRHPASPRQTGKTDAPADTTDASSFTLEKAAELQPPAATSGADIAPLPVTIRTG